jgi:flagellar protein FlaG
MDPVGVPRVSTPITTAADTPAAVQPAAQAASQPQQPDSTPGTPEPTPEAAEALDVLSESLRRTPFEARFSIDRDTNKVVIEFVERKSGDVIRQFPSEEALRISRSLDKLQGLLVHQTA